MFAAMKMKSKRRHCLAIFDAAVEAVLPVHFLPRALPAPPETGRLMILAAGKAAGSMALAAEVQTVLRGPQCLDFLGRMYGNKPTRWSDDLAGMQRLRGIVNVLTRLRFCTADGAMDLESKEGADGAPAGFLPWYEVPGRRTAATTVAFGHWSTLGWLGRHDVLSMDTGCVWGGCLSAVRMLAAPGAAHPGRELIQVRCPQAQKPGT